MSALRNSSINGAAGRTSGASGAHGDNGATFEESFAQLQSVVQRLSEGNLSLQDALACFEEGMRLAESCSQMLDQAELRVKQVTDRAMRSGSASMADLAAEMRAGGEAVDSPLVAIEFESFEATVIETPQPAQATPFPPARNAPSPFADDLDPLFDDED